MNNSLAHLSPKPRPLPQFFAENATFSTKKEKETPKLAISYKFNEPPKPPIKSCPPISRLRPRNKNNHHDGAKVITFLNNTQNNEHHNNENHLEPHNNTEMVSKYYDEKKHDLYFEQCFIIEGYLGCGSFGRVYKVKSKDDGNYYAVKKSREKFKGRSDRDRKLQEVAKHEELPDHPNFVKFYKAWEERQRLYIQTELCQMSLNTYADRHHNIPESQIWRFLVDLLQALKQLHDRRLVHMDIKPENIFISFHGHCKLGDFGLIVDLNKSDLKEVQEGDPKYLAPEILKSSNNITCAADIFSLGMTILELATDLDLPRGGETWHQLRNGQIPVNLVSSLSRDLVAIIMRMIEPDHLKRATVDDLLDFPRIRHLMRRRKRHYVVDNVYKLTSMLAYFIVSTVNSILQPFIRIIRFVRNSVRGDADESKDSRDALIPAADAIVANDRQHLLINGSLEKPFKDVVQNNNNNNNSKTDETNSSLDKKNTSTPKKEEFINNLPLNILNVNEDDDDDDDIDRSCNLQINDSFNFMNNSCGNQFMDSSSSFSDSELGDYSGSKYNKLRKIKTEPPANKKSKMSFQLELSPTTISPTSNLITNWSNNKQTGQEDEQQAQSVACAGIDKTPISFTRQRLVFDENDDDDDDDHHFHDDKENNKPDAKNDNNNNTKPMNPTDQLLKPQQKSTDFDQQL